MSFAPDCEEQASLLEEVPAQGQSRLGKPVVLALSSISACAFVVGWARNGAASRMAIDGLMSKSESGCVNDGDDCADSKCCNNAGSTCFKKNDHWASCNATCAHNHKWMGRSWGVVDYDVWDCEKLSTPTCTENGESCSESKCCSEWGATCYKKNDHWASCNATCNPYYKWNNNKWNKEDEKIWDCTPLSTPPCTHDGQSCAASECCVSPGSTCYKKNDHWSSCNATCTPNWLWVNNRWEEQPKDDKIWDCSVVGEEGGDGHDGEDAKCEGEAETECSECEAGTCKSCRYNARIKCCMDDTHGHSKAECCGIEGIPSWATECGGDGVEDDECLLEAETKCAGCGGNECITCAQKEKVECCLRRTCVEDCNVEPEDDQAECVGKCVHDNEEDADSRKACCVEQGVPTGEAICTVVD